MNLKIDKKGEWVMGKEFIIVVYGKQGCDKCGILKDRIKKLLDSKPEFQDFELRYVDIESEEGMTTFCELECLNTSDIPAFVICKFRPEIGRYEPLERQELPEDIYENDSKVFSYNGLKTDYSEKGKGIISKSMIKDELLDVITYSS